MGKDLEMRIIRSVNGQAPLDNPDSIHCEEGKNYFIYVSKEIADKPLTKLTLGKQIIDVFKNLKEAGYNVSEVIVRYKSSLTNSE